MQKSSTIYFFACAFIFGWWWIFQPSDEPATPYSQTENFYHVENGSYLEPIGRDDLKKALSGDFSKMVDLLITWDLEAEWMGSQNRLKSDEFREAILLFKSLKGSKEVKIIPQTHVAATILLAIAPKAVQAIPMGLRGSDDLFAPASLESIPLNCQSLEGETVQNLSPDFALVAPYSNPVFLKMLRNQKVPEIQTDQICSLEDLYLAIHDISELAKHPTEGRLLTLFMKGSIMAIDNRLHALKNFLKKDVGSVLYLSGEHPFYSPAQNSLISALLQRLEIKTYDKQFSYEDIELFSPDTLILASNTQLRLKSKRIYRVNSTVQDSPTQFAILAYRDIASCLMDRLIHE